MSVWVTLMTVSLVAAACWTDLRKMVIPNVLTGGFAAAGLIVHAITGGWNGVAGAIAGAAAGALPLLVLYRLKGLGGGDVKWFGAFGALAGAAPALRLLVFSILLAGCISLFLLLLRMPFLRRWAERCPWPWGVNPIKAGKGAAFPFMLAVAPAFVWFACFARYPAGW